MGVRNCSRCGKIFNYVAGQPICENCRKELEEQFQKVKAFIRENPHEGIQSTADQCEVPVNQIKQWIREERLEFAKGISDGLICESCGEPISTGRFCEKCKADMKTGLNDSIKAQVDARKAQMARDALRNTDHKGGMRFLKT